MTEAQTLDPLILGRRVRHYRNAVNLTLDELGEKVGKPAPYLSLLENGKKEPRVALMMDIASTLGVDVGELLDPSPPTRRDELEIALLKAQETSLFDSLDLPPIRPSARMSNETLAHLVGLHRAVKERSSLESAGFEELARATGAVSEYLASKDGYLDDIEVEAASALRASGYPGEGPFSSRNLLDLTSHAGFDLRPIDDMPAFARSIIDLDNNRIYIAQRDELRTRQARKAVLQTVAGFLLGHETEPDLDTFLRQRMETAYFATGVLVPQDVVVPRLMVAKENHDIDVEDVKELFYVSYEMAAWRTVNLLTRHFGIDSHLLVSDETGTIIKGYSNDEVPIPRNEHGAMETQRLCRHWGARITFQSPDKYGTHHQYTDTPNGTFFCTTHVEAGREPAHGITIGVRFEDARWMRGRETGNRMTSSCPDPACCRQPSPELTSKWGGKVQVSARSQGRILGMLAPDPYPELDMPQVLAVVDGHASD